MGEIRRRGVWYYYIVLLFVKTPIPILIAYFATMALLIKNYKQNLWIWVAFILPAGAIGFSLSMLRVQIGYRYFLPGVFLLMLACALTMQKWIKQHPSVWQPRALIGVLIALLWIQDWNTFRNNIYLSYFNPFAINPGRNFVDSNADWGQQVPAHILRKFPDYVKLTTLSAALNHDIKAAEHKIFVSTTSLSGLWDSPVTPTFRVFKPDDYRAGYEFFNVSNGDLFKMMWNRHPVLPVTNIELREYEKQLQPVPGLACSNPVVTIQTLYPGINKVKWESGPVIILHDDPVASFLSLNKKSIVEKRADERAKIWTQLSGLPEKNPKTVLTGSLMYLFNARCI